MLTLFFTIIFLAELIVASWIISKIRLASAAVCELNQKVISIQPKITKGIDIVKCFTNLLSTKLECFKQAFKYDKSTCKNILKNKYFIKLVLWLLKIPYKRVITVVEILFTIRKILNKI